MMPTCIHCVANNSKPVNNYKCGCDGISLLTSED